MGTKAKPPVGVPLFLNGNPHTGKRRQECEPILQLLDVGLGLRVAEHLHPVGVDVSDIVCRARAENKLSHAEAGATPLRSRRETSGARAL